MVARVALLNLTFAYWNFCLLSIIWHTCSCISIADASQSSAPALNGALLSCLMVQFLGRSVLFSVYQKSYRMLSGISELADIGHGQLLFNRVEFLVNPRDAVALEIEWTIAQAVLGVNRAWVEIICFWVHENTSGIFLEPIKSFQAVNMGPRNIFNSQGLEFAMYFWFNDVSEVRKDRTKEYYLHFLARESRLVISRNMKIMRHAPCTGIIFSLSCWGAQEHTV